VPRTQTNINTTTKHLKPLIKFNALDKNNRENNIDIKIILAYSAIKIKVKPPALYSVLNPETNSDSPSEKS
jgi:hypothetical protein